MRVAALVLAILGDVVGVFAAIAAFGFAGVLNTLSTPGASVGLVKPAGGDVAGGSLLALGAAIVGIVGTVVVNRRPKLAAPLLIGAGIAGIIGTLGFALAAPLYVIGGALAFFATPVPAQTTTAAATGGSLATVNSSSPRGPLLTRNRAVAAGGVLVVLLLLFIVGSVVNAADEQKPGRALFEAIAAGDDAKIALLVPAGQRSDSAATDAQRVLVAAFAGTDLDVLATEWTRKLGSAAGVRIAFDNLAVTTMSKSGDAAVVQFSGTFNPSAKDGLTNLGLGLLRRPFVVRLNTARTDGAWSLNGIAPASTAARPIVPGTPSTQAASAAPTVVPTAAPTLTVTPSPIPTPAPFAATFTASLAGAADGFPAPADVSANWNLRYTGASAIASGCKDLCYWGHALPASAAYAEVGNAKWSLLLRATASQTLGTYVPADKLDAAYALYSRDLCAIYVVNNGSHNQVKASIPCRNSSDDFNTMEFGVDGAQLYLKWNGVEVARVADSQTKLGTVSGVMFYEFGTPVVRSFKSR